MMPRSERATSAVPAAVEAFHPERFGFQPWHGGWVTHCEGIGAVGVSAVSWQHAQVVTGKDRHGSVDVLHQLVELQSQVWGMPPEDVVPANLLAVIEATGGSVLVAYHANIGFTNDGWLGFAIALGGRSGTLVAHMLAVRDDMRGTGSIGWLLKLLQGYQALRSGHTSVVWTFDPMRGANARLNIEKLGARVSDFTLDKYGVLRSALYGDVPSDRFTADWNLVDPATAERIAAVYANRYRGPEIDEVAGLPEITLHNLQSMIAAAPPRMRYRIPADIDQLARRRPEDAIQWRREMREVFGKLSTTNSALIRADLPDPLSIGVQRQPGQYVIDGFATGFNPAGERLGFYVLTRQASSSGEADVAG